MALKSGRVGIHPSQVDPITGMLIGGTGGLLPELQITATTGSTVTATKGTTVITATEISSGFFTCEVPEFGTYTVSDGTDSTTVTVDTVKIYEVEIIPTPSVISVTLTLYSATEDQVTVVDEDGTHLEQFTSGQSSKSITVKVLAAGSNVVFTSSVAKDPSDLSEYYSKTVPISSATTEVYCMPDNALYWYGYITEHLEYTLKISPLVSTLTFNTNSVTMYGNNTSQTNMAYAALIFNKPITSETTLKCYVSGSGINKNFGTDNNYAITSLSYLVDNSSPITIDAVSQHSLASQSGKYPAISCGGGTYYLHAIWAE